MTFTRHRRPRPTALCGDRPDIPPGCRQNSADIVYMESPAMDEFDASSPSASAAAGGSRLKRIGATLGLRLLTALTFSYLLPYAVTNALVSADVLSRWPPGTDPRPRRMLIT